MKRNRILAIGIALLLAVQLLQEKNEILHAVDEAITAARAARRETYRAAFERNMKRNTADPARHAKEEPYV